MTHDDPQKTREVKTHISFYLFWTIRFLMFSHHIVPATTGTPLLFEIYKRKPGHHLLQVSYKWGRCLGRWLPRRSHGGLPSRLLLNRWCPYVVCYVVRARGFHGSTVVG